MKKESLEEFLARGGQITKVPTEQRKETPSVIKTQSGGPAHLMSLEEGALFYSEIKDKKESTPKESPKLDINALPEVLRKKYIDKIKNEVNHGREEDEDNY